MLKLPFVALFTVIPLVSCIDTASEPLSTDQDDVDVAVAMNDATSELGPSTASFLGAIEVLRGGVSIDGDIGQQKPVAAASSCPTVTRDNAGFKDYTLSYANCLHSSGATYNGTVKLHLDTELEDGKQRATAAYSTTNLTRNGVSYVGPAGGPAVKLSTNGLDTRIDTADITIGVTSGIQHVSLAKVGLVVSGGTITFKGSGSIVQVWSGVLLGVALGPYTIDSTFTMTDVVLAGCYPISGTIAMLGVPREAKKLAFSLAGTFENNGLTIKLTFPELGAIGDFKPEFHPLTCI